MDGLRIGDRSLVRTPLPDEVTEDVGGLLFNSVVDNERGASSPDSSEEGKDSSVCDSVGGRALNAGDPL